MGYQSLIYKKEDSVGTITLNRPQQMNALSLGLYRELDAVLDEVEKDDQVRVLIITGAPRPNGDPCFCAGADIKEMAEIGGTISLAAAGLLASTDEILLRNLLAVGISRDTWQPAFNKLEAMPKPSIAAIDGVCTAGGLELALCCDLRVASQTARISDLHMKNLGQLGGLGVQTRLTRLLGPARAKEIMWTGDQLNIEEAKQMGLVNRVFPPAEMMKGAQELAKKVAAMKPLGIRLSKVVVNSAMSQSIHESLRFSSLCEALIRYMAPGEAKRAFSAFSDKTQPKPS